MVSVRNLVVGVLAGVLALLVIVSFSTHGFIPQTTHPLESNLPIVIIRMDSTTPVNVDEALEYQTAWMDVIRSDSGNNILHMPHDPNLVTEKYKIGIHIRGQSSRGNPKRPFAIKMYDYNSTELKKKEYSLFGFGKQDKYVLYSSYVDPSLIRNKVAFELSRSMGHFATKMQYIELFVVLTNSSDVYYPQHYHGVYLMSERIHRGNEWVDVKKMDVEDNEGKAVTGGYIFRVDKWRTGEVDPTAVIYTDYANYVVSEPSDEVFTPQKYAYLEDYIKRMEHAIMSPDYRAPTGEHYADLIDLQSFADMFITQELTKNVDAYRLSTYFYKDRNAKVKSGPVWDLDRTYGNELFGLDSPEGWMYTADMSKQAQDIPKYWPALLADPSFRLVVKNRWHELRQNTLSTHTIKSLIQQHKDELHETDAAERDYNRWGPWYFPFEFWITEPYSEHHIGLMQDWTVERLEWMDKTIATF